MQKVTSNPADGRLELIKQVAAIPQGQEEHIVAIAEKLITPEMTDSDRARVLEQAVAIPENDREAVVSRVLKLTATKTDNFAKKEVFINEAPTPDDRGITDALKLMSPNMDGRYRRLLLLIAAGISKDDLNDVINHALKLVTPTMGGFERVDLLEAVSLIHKDDRMDVITHTFKLVTPNLNENEIAPLVRRIAKIPKDDRKEVITHALWLASPSMNGFGRSSLLEQVGLIPKDDRKDVITHALGFISPIINDAKMSDLVAVLTKVPKNDRQDMVNHTLSLLNRYNTEKDLILEEELVGLLEALYVDDVINILPDILQEFHPELKDDKIKLDKMLEQMAQLSRKDRIDMIFNLLTSYDSEVDEESRLEILKK